MFHKRVGIYPTVILISPVAARAADPVKIGVMNDQLGIFSDLAAPGSVIAARMAVAVQLPDGF